MNRPTTNGFTIGGATDETGMRGFWSQYAIADGGRMMSATWTTTR